MKQKRIGALALSAVLTALALVCLLLTITPIATVGTVALAAVCAIPVVTETGRRGGAGHVVAVTVLAWLLVPNMEGKMLYTAFFGWYTVFKAWLEAKNLPRPTEWLVKLVLFWIALAAGGAAWYFLLSAPTEMALQWWMLPIGAVIATALFAVYDHCLTGLVGMYITRLQPILRRLFKFQ